MPRLSALCRKILPLHYKINSNTANGVPKSTLVNDFGGALGESTWADVRFIAGGRSIYAHRAILSAASEYFDMMFRSGMREGQQNYFHELMEIVVP